MRVAERAFGSEVKWSAPTSPRILEAVLIEMVMNLSAQYFPYTLTKNRLYFRHLQEITQIISGMPEIEGVFLNTRFRDG